MWLRCHTRNLTGPCHEMEMRTGLRLVQCEMIGTMNKINVLRLEYTHVTPRMTRDNAHHFVVNHCKSNAHVVQLQRHEVDVECSRRSAEHTLVPTNGDSKQDSANSMTQAA